MSSSPLEPTARARFLELAASLPIGASSAERDELTTVAALAWDVHHRPGARTHPADRLSVTNHLLLVGSLWAEVVSTDLTAIECALAHDLLSLGECSPLEVRSAFVSDARADEAVAVAIDMVPPDDAAVHLEHAIARADLGDPHPIRLARLATHYLQLLTRPSSSLSQTMKVVDNLVAYDAHARVVEPKRRSVHEIAMFRAFVDQLERSSMTPGLKEIAARTSLAFGVTEDDIASCARLLAI